MPKHMAPISQGLVFTTVMVISSTVLYLAFSRQKNSLPFRIPGYSVSQHSNKQILRSCLYSDEKKREGKKNKKKKVQFADNVKEARETSKELVKKEQRNRNRVSSNCRNEIVKIRDMPKNRIALYNGILRDRVHRMECSF